MALSKLVVAALVVLIVGLTNCGTGGGDNCTKGCSCGQACISCDFNCTKEDVEAMGPDGTIVSVQDISISEDTD